MFSAILARSTWTTLFSEVTTWVAAIVSKNFLSGAVIYISAAVGFLTILDWLLSQKQKGWLTKFFEDLWIWLALQKSGRFIRVLRIIYVQLAIAVLGISLIAFGQYNIIIHHPGYDPSAWRTTSATMPLLYLSTATFIVTFVLLRVYLNFLTKSAVMWRYMIKILITLELIADFYGLLKFGLIYAGVLNFDPDLFPHLNRSFLAKALMFTFFIPLEIFSQEVLRIALFSVGWLLLVLILMSGIRIAQFFAYKIATYEKGPVLAVSALLGGCAALIKALG